MNIDARVIEECKILEKRVVLNPTDTEEYTIKFTDNFYIKTDGVRGLLNIYLQEIFEYYEIPLKERAKLIFRGDYSKGAPTKYRMKVLDTVFPILKNRQVQLFFVMGMVSAALHKLSFVISPRISMDHSLWGYLDAYDNHPEFKAMMDTPLITANDAPWEVVKKEKQITDTLVSAEVYPINLMFKAGVKINNKQAQALVQIGPMPGYIDKNRTRHNVLGGILNGIKLPKDMFQMDNAGRLVLISEKTEVKEPGTINKHVGISLASFKLNDDLSRKVIHDCHTHLGCMDVYIENEKVLNSYTWKYIYENGKRVGHITPDRKDLIGKTVTIRTSLFCTSDTVCEECMGYMAEFFQDTSVWKSSAYMFIMDVIGALVQNLISIKHNNSAKMLPVRVKFRDKIYETLEDFFNVNKDILTDVQFDWLVFNDDLDIQYIGFDADNFETPFLKNWIVLVEGEPIYFDNPVYPPEDPNNPRRIQYYIPNDSVFIKAEDMMNMLQKHNNNERVERDTWSERYKFAPASRTKLFNQNSEEYMNATIKEQIIMFYNYARTVIEFPHFIYYEALIYGLMRDKDDYRKRINKDSKGVTFYNIENILSTPGITSNLTTKIHHGYIKNNLLVPTINVEPSEFDIIYNKLWDRESQETFKQTCSLKECSDINI